MRPTRRFSALTLFTVASVFTSTLSNVHPAWAQEGAPGGIIPGGIQPAASHKPFTFRDAVETDSKEGAGLVTASAASAASKRAIAARRIEQGATMLLTEVKWKRPIHPRVLNDEDIKEILQRVEGSLNLNPSKMWKIPGASAIIEIDHDAPQVSRAIGRQNVVVIEALGSSTQPSTLEVDGAENNPAPRGRNPSHGRQGALPVAAPVFQPDPSLRGNAGSRINGFISSLTGTGNGAPDDPNPQFRPKQIVVSEHGADTMKVVEDELKQLKKSGVVVRAVNIRTPWKNFLIRSLGGLGNLFIAGAAGAGASRIINAGSIYFGTDKVELDQPFISDKEEKPGLVDNFLSSAPKKAYDFQHSSGGAALK